MAKTKIEILKKILVYILFIAAAVSIVAGGGYSGLRYLAKVPFSDSAEVSVFEVPSGAGLVKVSSMLSGAGLIRSEFVFKANAVILGSAKRIRAGEYELRKNMTVEEILSILAEGRVKLHRLVIPEGVTVQDIADLVESSGLSDRKNFMDAANDKTFIRELGIKQDSLEGYLFPETYSFPKNTPPKKIIKTMVSDLFNVLSQEFMDRADKLGLSLNEVLTLASIIEKETGQADERPIISSVFHNRLKLGMRLETDPTVIYGIKGFDGNLTRRDLEAPTPYNTYVIKGLPPGPIANPGLLAIKAALYPASTNYLYFVSRNDSTHYFSSNYQEHLAAVRKYQMRKRQD